MMHAVLMVCLGNICRSPMAQGVFEAHAREAGLNVLIDSAGTAGYHQGRSPDPRAIQVAAEWGIDISHQRARQLTPKDLQTFDQIYVMDQASQVAVHKLSSVNATARVELVMSLVKPSHDMAFDDVPDPYYGPLDDFRSVIKMLDQAAQRWVDRQRRGLSK